MTVVRNIHPASAFKLGAIINGFVGLLLGLVCTATTVAGIAFARNAHISLFGPKGAFVGYFAVIFCPIVYGLIGGISAALGACIYNVASGWIGGLEIETN